MLLLLAYSAAFGPLSTPVSTVEGAFDVVVLLLLVAEFDLVRFPLEVLRFGVKVNVNT